MSWLMASFALADFGRCTVRWFARARLGLLAGTWILCSLARVETFAGEHVTGLARDTHLWFLFEARRTYGWSTAGARDRACEQFSGPLPIFGLCAMGASSPGVPLPDFEWATRDLADLSLIVSA
jgi:hypothetical protein